MKFFFRKPLICVHFLMMPIYLLFGDGMIPALVTFVALSAMIANFVPKGKKLNCFWNSKFFPHRKSWFLFLIEKYFSFQFFKNTVFFQKPYPPSSPCSSHSASTSSATRQSSHPSPGTLLSSGSPERLLSESYPLSMYFCISTSRRSRRFLYFLVKR